MHLLLPQKCSHFSHTLNVLFSLFSGVFLVPLLDMLFPFLFVHPVEGHGSFSVYYWVMLALLDSPSQVLGAEIFQWHYLTKLVLIFWEVGQVSHSFVLSVLHDLVLKCLEIMVDGMTDDNLVLQNSMRILLCLRERYRPITLFEMGRGDAAHPSSEVCDSPCRSNILVVQHMTVVVDDGHPKTMITMLM